MGGGKLFDDLNWNTTDKYTLILTRGSLPFDKSSLKKLRDKYDVKLVLLSLDLWTSKAERVSREFEEDINFDYIITFDPEDAEKYNFIFCNAHYSMIETDDNIFPRTDMFFIGYDKGRLSELEDIYLHANKNDVKTNYIIAGISKKNQIIDGIKYNETMDYVDVIKKCVLNCNCLLEVVIKNQTGATLRYNEAVCYNRKLLTNNKHIVDFPFYNPDYMHIFDRIEDIDWQWVKERIPIDYHYDGEFSPVHLIDKILELEDDG